MSDETHTGRKVVVVSLKNRIIEMTSQAKSCRDAYEGDYMRVPLGFMADALRDAAQVLQSRLDTVIGKRDQLSMEPADAVKSEALKANPHFTQTHAPEGIEQEKNEKDLGAVSATAVDAVPCLVPADAASHAVPVISKEDRADALSLGIFVGQHLDETGGLSSAALAKNREYLEACELLHLDPLKERP